MAGRRPGSDSCAHWARISSVGVTMVGAHHLVALDGGDRCRNELRLRLSGFGSGVLRGLLGRTFRSAIETENQGFKRAAEAAHRAGR